ncbi:hypothetical protein HZ994_11240 [Akkermansiaceae bacterium]|nr:hypothetical protein HZ994_11240 [Akkermansiaceae bacterium]
MKFLSWLSLLIFACGFLFAWLVKPAQNVPAPPESAAIQNSARPRAVTAPLRRDAVAKRQAEARLDRHRASGKDWISEGTEDYPELVAALQREAGFGGLDAESERLLKKIVVSWYDSEPEAALDWALNLGNLADEGVMMSAIVNHCAESDWRAAVAFAERYGAADGREIDMPRIMLEKVMQTLSPEEFVRIDRMFTGASAGNDSRVKVGDDFRFAETLDLYGNDEKPQAVLEEWAQRDFGAVWEWASDRDEPQFKNESSLRALAGIWAAQADDGQIAGFAAYLMGDAGPADAPDRNLEIAWHLLRERPVSEVLPSVLEIAPGNRQDQLNRLLRIGATDLKFGKENDLVRQKLLGQMSPVELIAAFKSNRDAKWLGGTYYKEPLALLGYSPEQIERMLPE